MPPRHCRLALAVAVCLVAALSLERVAHAEPGDELTIAVLTFGPGDHPFYKFGHNAILVTGDRRVARAAVYNFGTFGFGSPWLIIDFLKGKLDYWLSVQPLASTIDAYRAENRSTAAGVLLLLRRPPPPSEPTLQL